MSRRPSDRWKSLLHGDAGVWREPPDDVFERALDLGDQKRLPRGDARRRVRAKVTDVRSAGGPSVADDARILAASCPDGEVSVLVHPPLDDARWRFEVRVWFADAPADSTATVGLVHDDHVLQRVEVGDGETLRFDDVVPEGWTLEIHMPGGATVVLDDPFHAE